VAINDLKHALVHIAYKTDNHTSTSPLNFFTGRMLFLTPNELKQHQRAEVVKEKKFLKRAINNKNVETRLYIYDGGKWRGRG